MLQINDLTLWVGGRKLFDRAGVAIGKGQRVGLVGPNGAGKTTLLRLIMGELGPDEGRIELPARWRVGTVAQEAPSGPASLVETVLAADAERTRLLAEAEVSDDGHALGEVHARLADIAAHSAPARAARILAGLGFDAERQERPVGELSGGLRMRVALAAVLFSEPDLLLLDEPTNHLDLESTLWLEGYLKTYPHTVLMVSHDRDLLNRAVNQIVHLEQGKLTLYSGGYDTFERTRRMRLEHQAALQSRQTAQRRHMQEFIDRFRYKASKARQAQSRIKALERMEPIATVIEQRTVSFDFPQPEPLSPPLLALDQAAAGYDGRTVLSGLNLRLDPDDRIALLGPNGNGKSTLVKLLAGRLRPMGGDVRKPPKLKTGYFAQHQTDELSPGLTALEQARAWMPLATEQKLRDHLGRFGFSGERALTRIADLSGGEKARLLLALMSREAPQLLLLDEPTNHLDVDARESLVHALNDYDGAVVLITHDPHLIELVADRLWLVANGTCRPFDGDLDDYRQHLARERGGNDRNGARPAVSDRKAGRRDAAERRLALAPLRQRVSAAERAIARLVAEKQALERRLADPALYAEGGPRVTQLTTELAEIRRRLAAAETEWLEAEAAHEQAAAE